MRKILLSLFLLLSTMLVMAVPAHRGIAKVLQPDGSYLSLRLHGDEWLSFNTTADGYSVVKDSKGYYVYAQLNEGRLLPTEHVAHDAPERSAAENQWLEGVRKFQAPAMSERNKELKTAEVSRRSATLEKRRAAQYDYTKFRGLVILVEFNDCSFSRDDYQQVMDDMLNKENYAGYDNSKYGRYTGSVRDYFSDNSMGMFNPQFDLIGPIQVDYSMYKPHRTDSVDVINLDILNKADALVDFSKYDGDGDGFVDMVFLVYAGLGSNISGNDPRLVWPHASAFVNKGRYIRKDGVYLWRYACSTELYGTEESNILDGIGTICHEFSHVLGLQDLYDTDYEKSGGESNHPGDWSIMAGGSYLNNSRTPAGYSLYERYSIGFSCPEVINAESSITLEPLPLSNKGYRIDSSVKDEFFLLENRQPNQFKWDAYLPGHGMLVQRVDSTNKSVWQRNQVNANPSHNYFVLLRAGGSGYNVVSASDPFPGTKNVTELHNSTSPASLKTWSGQPTKWGLFDIKEQDGIISFDVRNTLDIMALSLPDSVTVGEGLFVKLKATPTPEFAEFTAEWTSSNDEVATVDENGVVMGVSEGECLVTVTAANGISASCHVTVEAVTGKTIAEFKAMEEQDEAMLLLNDAEVLFSYQTRVYLRDSTGAITLNNIGLSLNNNDRVSGLLYGKLTSLNNMPQVSPVAETTDIENLMVTEGEGVQPHEKTLEELSSDDYSDYVKVKAVKLVRDVYCYAVSGDRRVRVYTRFGTKGGSLPSNYNGKYFDVEAIFGTNRLNGQVIDELYIVKTPTEVEAPSGIVELRQDDVRANQPVYNLQGQRVSPTTKGIVISRGRKLLNQ